MKWQVQLSASCGRRKVQAIKNERKLTKKKEHFREPFFSIFLPFPIIITFQINSPRQIKWYFTKLMHTEKILEFLLWWEDKSSSSLISISSTALGEPKCFNKSSANDVAISFWDSRACSSWSLTPRSPALMSHSLEFIYKTKAYFKMSRKLLNSCVIWR